MATSWTTQYKSADDLLSAKANAMNRGQSLAEGQTAGGWTPAKVQSEIDKVYGGSVDSWWENAGQYEDLSDKGTWTPSSTVDMSNAPTLNSGTDIWNSILGQGNITLPSVSTTIDWSNAPSYGSVNTDWDEQRRKANETALELLTQGWDDRYAQSQSDLESQLVGQGVQRGTEAWDRAMTEFTDARDKAYANAAGQAYLTGLNEMSTLFNMDLSAANLANTNRNQWLNEQLSNAQLGNNAQNQLVSQLFSAAQLGNSARGQYFNEQLQSGQFQNESAYQDLQMDQLIAKWENDIRNQQIQEDLYQRNLPLNELIALLSGTQVTTPTFTQTSTAQSPYQPYYSGGSGNNWLSDLMGLGGSLGSAGILAAFMSSRKIKNIHGKAEGMLEKLRSLEVGRWTYKEGEDKAEHVSPYAEDWAERFGGTGKDISIIDAIGVLTKAIQELADRVEGNNSGEEMESEENGECSEMQA